MPHRAVPPIALDFLRQAEGLRLTPYTDSTGHLTVGYGHRTTDPRPLMMVDAERFLANDADEAAGLIEDRVAQYEILKLAEHQWAALIAFVFNLGCGDWQIWKLLAADHPEQVPTQMLRFDHGVINGRLVEIPGLRHRRLAEIALWSRPDVEAATSGMLPTPPSPVTRSIVTPPAPPAPKPLATASLTAKIVNVAAASGAAAVQAYALAAPHAGNPHAAVALVSVAVAAGISSLAISHKQNKEAAT